MSGGSFNYAYSRVQDFCETLTERIKNNDVANEYGDVCAYPPEVLEVLKTILAQAEQMTGLMKEVEWLYSGDCGPETFLERVAEHLSSAAGPRTED